jgi:hypothetical protein
MGAGGRGVIAMRRVPSILLVTALLLAWPLAAAVGGVQATHAATSAAPSLRADFNGDGAADLVIGVPGESLGAGQASAGVVQVLYGSGGGLTATASQLWSQDSPGVAGVAEARDGLGGALATGDFNGDGRGDLAVGVSQENQGRGVVQVLAGSAAGLAATGSQLWSQDSPGVGGIAEAGDSFGVALAAGDFNNSGYADLAVGAAGEDIGSVADAGAVNVLYGTGGGLAGGNQQWFQNSPGVAGISETQDFLGNALTAGDFNGDERADLAAGAPSETLAVVAEAAGAVKVLYGAVDGLSAGGNQVWS